jgi:hypothetical protein
MSGGKRASLSLGPRAPRPPSVRQHALILLILITAFCSRYALAAGESPAVPVKTLAFIPGKAFRVTHYPSPRFVRDAATATIYFALLQNSELSTSEDLTTK